MDAFCTDVRPLLAELARARRDCPRGPDARVTRLGLPAAHRRGAGRRHPGRLGRVSAAHGRRRRTWTRQSADLIARSNRLGADPRNTNYAGGNTSAKGIDTDPATGQPVELRVGEGLGRRPRHPHRAGLAALRLDRVRGLVAVYPGVEREDEMVAAFDYCLHGKGGAAPSIDTAMHGARRAAHVDHLHPDAGIAIATAADGEALTRQIFGDKVVWVPWRRPGFQLGLDIARDQAREPAMRSAASSAATASPRGATTSDECESELAVDHPHRRGLHRRARQGRAVRRAVRGVRAAARARAPACTRRRARADAARARVARTARWSATSPTTPVVLDFLSRSEHPRLAALGTSLPRPLPAHQGQADGARPAGRLPRSTSASPG